MDRLYTASLGLNVPSVGQNLLFDVAVAMRVASATAVTTQDAGLDGRVYQATSDLNTGTLILLDDATVESVDTVSDPAVTTTSAFVWYDREVFGIFRGFAGASQYPGGANDYQFDAAGAPVVFWGYLGRGALDGGGLSPSAGNPPVPAAGTSWAVQIGYPSITGLWLYIDPADGGLRLYNDTGSTQRTPSIWFEASAPTGKRP